MTYKLYKTTSGENGVIRLNEYGSTNSFLFDPSNTDYQAYLKWLDAGNTPEPADEVANG